MKYKVKIKTDHAYDLDSTFDCGQCFRWEKVDEAYKGIANQQFVLIYRQDHGLIIESNSSIDENFWLHYLGLDADYNQHADILMQKDDHMKKAVEYSIGLHLLNQEFEEALISFIISANNNVARIKGIIKKLCERFGTYIDREHYTFPAINVLANAKEHDLKEIGAGYRAPYIIAASKQMMDGMINPCELSQMSLPEARKMMQVLSGVGPKVADCVLLYGGIRKDVFPTDVWVKRIMEELYFFDEVGIQQVLNFADKYFGQHAGLAQQFLFHYARMNKIGTIREKIS